MRLPQDVGCVQRTGRKRFWCVSRTRQLIGVGLALAIASAAGCGSKSSKTSEAGKDDPKDVATHKTPELPDLDEPLPMALDDGHIKVSPPEGWITPPRTQKYVVRFKAGSKLIYPVIGIMAKDYTKIEGVTKDNVEEFAKQIGEAVSETGDKCSYPVRPYSFGNWVGVTYEQKGKSGNFILDRRVLETVVGNRKYTFELLAMEGTVEKYWPHLLAVAAGVEYVKTGGEAGPADKKPAEKTPAEETPELKTTAEKRPAFEEEI